MPLVENPQLLFNQTSLPSDRETFIKKEECYFTVMLCGSSGTGKTTFCNNLFSSLVKPPKSVDNFKKVHKQKEVHIDKTKATIEEDDFRLNLTVLDTVGFGDFINNKDCWEVVADYLDDQHEKYLLHDQQSLRMQRKDNRVHVCLYFIKPVPYGMLPLDVVAMKKLSKHVNIIPVIAKADSLTKFELDSLKEKMNKILHAQNISLFFPSAVYSADEIARDLSQACPFAIVASMDAINDENEGKIGRKYPWGMSEIENEDHGDFLKLKNLMINNHMLELIQSTEQVIYERYRQEQLINRKSGIPKLRKAHYERLNEEKALIQKKLEEKSVELENTFKEREEKLTVVRDDLNDELAEYHDKVRILETQLDALRNYKGLNQKK
ncbi:meiotic (sporulation) septin Spn6 [Schizosaccharomyces osmophilus]|uniref:Meiotic (Sporulation) septin Spn6 n=1 Tax=Schizosaccharomyces osmophilus TaxID=2545709 RepID=A0AAE9WGX1_9SCHI|nr:meiotic (sporulation) septin Spn6 [Schizosaccharomyces osmophilus]WBW75565.1 meiotic (sporulation) septin Spn6 [Schizosaccharomyces osmophilus]